MKKTVVSFIILLAVVFVVVLIYQQLTLPKATEAPVTTTILAQADLVVASIEVKAEPKKGTVKQIVYRVKNQGKTSTPASTIKIKVHLPTTKLAIHTVTQAVPALPPGQSYIQTINYTVAKEGKYEINAQADYKDKVMESDEMNNHNTLRFSVGRVL